MKSIGCILLILLVQLAAGAGSMFDLPPGSFEDRPPNGDYTRLVVGTPDHKRLTLVVGRPSRDDRSTEFVGTYRVTATKGDYHVTWKIDSIQQRGALRGQPASLGGMPVKQGDEIRLILSYDEAGVRLTVFDPEIVPVLTLDLKERK